MNSQLMVKEQHMALSLQDNQRLHALKDKSNMLLIRFSYNMSTFQQAHF